MKLRVGDPAALRRRLAALGVGLSDAVVQEDTFFRHASALRQDEALRLRKEGGAWELTFKGPRQPGSAKTRVEETVALGGDASALLSHLGFHPAAHVRKTREQGRLKGAHVALDHVDGLGWFLEVEVVLPDGSVPSDGARAGADAVIAAALRDLGLGEAPRVREAYVELLAQAADA